jgi:SRSO17 transposase
MDFHWRDGDSEARFTAYLEHLSVCLGHADRVGPFGSYCTGLLLPGDRKSVEPMAARLRPDRTSAAHQSLLHFVGQSAWDEKALPRSVWAAVLPVMTERRPIETWIVDDTGFPKKGDHSVGVARQYCGQLGKQENCQVAVSLSVATSEASLPVAWQLYLPEAWAGDAARRRKAKVPETIGFQTKPEIALDQITEALAEGLASGVVLADAGYGKAAAFRDGLAALDLEFVVAVPGTAAVWPPGMTPEVPSAGRRGPRAKRLRRAGDGAPVEQVAALAKALPVAAWQLVRWRAGTAEALASRFVALRLRPAARDHRRSTPRPEQWLLAEWPPEEARPTDFWFSNLPAETSLKRLVTLAKRRWMIERDYLELKQELGLGHYEGRGWPGFHHHGALCIAAYGFLIAEKAALPPSAPETTWLVQVPELPKGHRPRGSPDPNRTPSAQLDRNTATTHRTGPGTEPASMSMLRRDHHTETQTKNQLMTQ